MRRKSRDRCNWNINSNSQKKKHSKALKIKRERYICFSFNKEEKNEESFSEWINYKIFLNIFRLNEMENNQLRPEFVTQIS